MKRSAVESTILCFGMLCSKSFLKKNNDKLQTLKVLLKTDTSLLSTSVYLKDMPKYNGYSFIKLNSSLFATNHCKAA